MGNQIDTGTAQKIKQLIDGEPHSKRRSQPIVNQELQAPLPESAKWHMRHKPYQYNRK